MTDQELADRLYDAVQEVNAARAAALDAGLDASVASFRDGGPFVAHVSRVIPAVRTNLLPSRADA
jgi:hypothetical protein